MHINYKNRPFVIVDLGSGLYTLSNEGHEKYNEVINPISGKYLGYAPRMGGLNITKLGGKSEDEKVTDVLVIYTRRFQGTADRYISSFIPSATIYAKIQPGKGLQRKVKTESGIEDTPYSIESDELISLEHIPDNQKFIIRLKDYDSSHIFRGQRIYKGTHPKLDKDIPNYLESLYIDFQESLQTAITTSEKKGIDNSRNAPEYEVGTFGKEVKKKQSISKYALYKANHKCECDSTHTTFENKNGRPFMEGHHLIPCTASNSSAYWAKFGTNIDCLENICCICPNCHRQIHYGSDSAREAVLKVLYKKKESGLHNIGIPITLQELLDLYK